MSFKLSSLTNFFSRSLHSVQNDKKDSGAQLDTVNSRKTRKTDSKFSSSKIARFFDSLFHSKKKARENVDTAIKSVTSQNSGILDVKESSNECADLSIYDLIANTPGHIKIPATSSSDITESSHEENSTRFIGPETFYAELDQRRNFIDSDEGVFMITITDMGSCVNNPKTYFRNFPGLDLQKTLADAFQIYYEEGKLTHEDSFATPGWEYEPTAQSLTDLESLKANLEKISAKRENEQKLIQKAIGAIEGRIDRIEGRQKTSGGTLNHGD